MVSQPFYALTILFPYFWICLANVIPFVTAFDVLAAV